LGTAGGSYGGVGRRFDFYGRWIRQRLARDLYREQIAENFESGAFTMGGGGRGVFRVCATRSSPGKASGRR